MSDSDQLAVAVTGTKPVSEGELGRGRISIPIVVLSGSDRRPVKLPESGERLQPLSGYKGVDLLIDGATLISRVTQRLADSGCFAHIYVAGPARVHAGLDLNATLLNVDGSIEDNVRAAVNEMRLRHPGCPVAFTTCDVLARVSTYRSVMDDFCASEPCDIYFPLVRRPDDVSTLGASSWKPSYSVVLEDGEIVTVLPGHLLIARPDALRLDFVYRLLGLTYRTRNRTIPYRRNVMIRGLIFELLNQDLRNILSGRPPTVTVSVVLTGIVVAMGLRKRTISRGELGRRARKVFVTSRHRRLFPERKVMLPVVEGLELAMDIDTVEEARSVGAEMRGLHSEGFEG